MDFVHFRPEIGDFLIRCLKREQALEADDGECFCFFYGVIHFAASLNLDADMKREKKLHFGAVAAHLDRRRAVKARECLCEAFRRFVTVFERDVYDLFVGLREL